MAGRQGPQAGLAGSGDTQGLALLLGYPGLVGGHGVCLMIQDSEKATAVLASPSFGGLDPVPVVMAIWQAS